MYRVIPEAKVEPESADQTHKKKKQNLREYIESPFLFPPPCNVPVIIHASENAEHHESKERQIDLSALKKRVLHETIVRKYAREKHCEEDGTPDEKTPHRGCAGLLLVEVPEHTRLLTIHRLYPELFSYPILTQETQEPWCRKYSHEECEKRVNEDCGE